MELGGKWFMAAAAMLATGVVAGSVRAGERTEQSSALTPGWQAGRAKAGRDDAFARNLVHGRLLALRTERTRRRAETLPRDTGKPMAASAWAGAGLDYRWGGFVLADPLDAAASTRAVEGGAPEYALAGGIDYRFTPELAGGLALSWSGARQQSPRGGDGLAANAWGLSAYASYNLGDLYVDGQLGFARLDFRPPRRDDIPLPFGLSASARDGAAGNQWAATVGVGYDLRTSDVVLTPYSRLNYVRLRLDTFSDRGGGGPDADLGPRGTESLQSAFGVRLSSLMHSGRRRVTPYVAVEWNREFGDTPSALTAPYTPAPFTTFVAIESERPTRDFLTVSLGLASVQTAGLSAFVKLDTVFGRDRVPDHAFILGVRGEF